MKHALLITAYKDFEELIRLINLFDLDFDVYIHIDSKSKIDNGLKQRLLGIPNVKHLSTEFKISWGGINHLLCYLALAKEALKNPDTVYFHFLTAQDYPIQTISRIKNLSSSLIHRDFLEYFEMPADCWTDGGMERVHYYHLHDLVNPARVKKWNKKFIDVQKKLRLTRPYSKKLPKLYGGSVFCSLSNETMQYVLRYTATNARLIKRFKFTFCSEEMYLQTVVMNSPYAGNVINDNLRYIDWNKAGRVLDGQDLQGLMESNKLFGRKFHPVSSAKLKDLLDEANTELSTVT